MRKKTCITVDRGEKGSMCRFNSRAHASGDEDFPDLLVRVKYCIPSIQDLSATRCRALDVRAIMARSCDRHSFGNWPINTLPLNDIRNVHLRSARQNGSRQATLTQDDDVSSNFNLHAVK